MPRRRPHARPDPIWLIARFNLLRRAARSWLVKQKTDLPNAAEYLMIIVIMRVPTSIMRETLHFMCKNQDVAHGVVYMMAALDVWSHQWLYIALALLHCATCAVSAGTSGYSNGEVAVESGPPMPPSREASSKKPRRSRKKHG